MLYESVKDTESAAFSKELLKNKVDSFLKRSEKESVSFMMDIRGGELVI